MVFAPLPEIDVANTVLRDGATFSSTINAEHIGQFMGELILAMDGKEHRSYRNLVAHAFRASQLEQWGATQIQNRFRRLANRPMESLDYDAWVAVRAIGAEKVRVRQVLTSAWTTDWLTEAAHAKLRDLGIAPPEHGQGSEALFARARVACARCHSMNTERISTFGSTACDW